MKVLATTILMLSLAACGGKESLAPEEMQARAFADFRAKIEAVVVDPTRREAILAQMTTLEAEFDALKATVEQRRTELRQLYLDYDATRAQLEEVLTTHHARVRRARKAVGDAHLALISTTTEEEWAVLDEADTEAMKSLIALLQAI